MEWGPDSGMSDAEHVCSSTQKCTSGAPVLHAGTELCTRCLTWRCRMQSILFLVITLYIWSTYAPFMVHVWQPCMYRMPVTRMVVPDAEHLSSRLQLVKRTFGAPPASYLVRKVCWEPSTDGMPVAEQFCSMYASTFAPEQKCTQ